jgi:hypothetical protein
MRDGNNQHNFERVSPLPASGARDGNNQHNFERVSRLPVSGARDGNNLALASLLHVTPAAFRSRPQTGRVSPKLYPSLAPVAVSGLTRSKLCWLLPSPSLGES